MLPLFRAPRRHRLRTVPTLVLIAALAASGIGPAVATEPAHAVAEEPIVGGEAGNGSAAGADDTGAGDTGSGDAAGGAAGEVGSSAPEGDEAPPSDLTEETQSEEAQLDDGPGIAPFALNPQFAQQNLNRYFILRGTTGEVTTPGSAGEGNWNAQIYYSGLNNDSTRFTQSTTKLTSSDLQLGPQRSGPAPTFKWSPNALGVTKTGLFYIAQQYRALDTVGGVAHEYVDIWTWESGDQNGNNKGPSTPVVKGFDLGVSGFNAPSNSAPQNIVAGAVNPVDGSYYFGFYRPVAPGEKYPQGTIAMHLYRVEADPLAPSGFSAGQVATAITPNGSYLTGTNGDFTFDSGGNLTFVVSDQRKTAGTYIGVIPASALSNATIGTPSTITGFTISNKLEIATGAACRRCVRGDACARACARLARHG